MLVFSLVFAAAVSGAATTFIERVSDNGSPHPRTISVGTLPPDWSAPAPLPASVPLLGSVRTPNVDTEIYYQPADARAALQSYLQQLRAAGFHRHLGGVGQSGFVFAQLGSNLTVMCTNGTAISILVPANDDMRVNFTANYRLSACASQPPRFSSPVPQLVAPAGTTVTGGGGGGVAWGQYDGSSSYSSATFASALSAKQLLAAFATQMQNAHWIAQAPFTAPQGAAQTFRYDVGSQHWSATLLLFAGGKPHTYEGRLDATGSTDFQPPESTIAAEPAPRLRRSDVPAALRLAQRVADLYSSEPGRTGLYVHSVPPAWNAAVPKPAGVLLGGTAAGADVTLYYELTRAQFDAYVANLRGAGWSLVPNTFPRSGGFANPAIENTTAFCRPHMPFVYASVREHSNDVAIRSSAQMLPSRCTPQNLPMAGPPPSAPVPALRAPAGATMHPGSSGIFGGNSGATIVSSQPLAAILGDFAAQLTASKWHADAPLVSASLGSQTFTYADSAGAHWQAVLTVYRSEQDPKTYYAFIDATQI